MRFVNGDTLAARITPCLENGKTAHVDFLAVKYDPQRHHRRSIRLKGYDYSQAGAYFVTICTQNRVCLFGEVAEGEMWFNDAGQMVETVWGELPIFYPGVDIDGFVAMPNHIHGIIVLVGAAPRGRPDLAPPQAMGQARGPAPTLSLSDVVHRFKTMTTKRYADGVKQWGWMPFPDRLWQRNYYEHIIRDEESLNRIRQYIVDNPACWAMDRENSQAVTPEPDAAWFT
jgi:REP element-mobilizing transposase RayT